MPNPFITPPPTLPDGKGIGGVYVLLPIAGSTASLTLMMFFRGSGFAALGAVMMVVVLLATAVMYLSQRGQAARETGACTACATSTTSNSFAAISLRMSKNSVPWRGRSIRCRRPCPTSSVIICDCYGHDATPLPLPDNPSALGVTIVHLVADRTAEPSEVSVRLSVHNGELTVFDAEGVRKGEVDRLPVALAEGLARTLSPLRLSQESYDDGSGTPPADFADLIAAHRQSERDFLRVPIGVDTVGEPVLLDLKESAQLGMGPHGLCVGATGSGKCELLRTLVLGLAATHSPERPRARADRLQGRRDVRAVRRRCPHVAGIITNLADDPGLVEPRPTPASPARCSAASRPAADAGNVADIAAYAALRADERCRTAAAPVRDHRRVR